MMEEETGGEEVLADPPPLPPGGAPLRPGVLRPAGYGALSVSASAPYMRGVNAIAY